MKRRNNMKNKSMLMFIGILVTLIVVACVTPTFADTIIISGGNTNVTSQNDTTGNTVANNTANVTANVASTTTNIVKNTTTNTTLPQTGVTDGYVVAILVAVCGVSAIYAYRKIRNYNIK